jgi:nicotinic acid mononucleotide adenylyltransferase
MRKGYDFTPGADYFLKTHKGRCIVIDDQSIPMVSSSAVRRAVIKGSEAEEKDIKSLEYIKEPVKKYILEKGLYKN